ncbi:hypothetical protein LguiA_006407 [Lonicera macranthoides]
MTVDSTSTSTACTLESIPTVDLHLLSQSELYSLSLCSHSSSALNFSEDDVVIPKIDRSVFNESAGSRKQTYSRLRLAPASSSSTAIRRRTPHLRSSRPPPDTSTDNDPERAENSQIIHLLKELFAKENNNNNKNDLLPINVDYSDSVPDSSNAKKRKRGRPRKDRSGEVLTPVKAELGFDVIKDIFYNENVEDRDLDSSKDREIANKNGVVVDLGIVRGLIDPYGAELRRRTDGMTTAEELLGFLGGLNGQWGSRRKKRMVVDANDFGDVLPNGWKILLSLKRKEGHVWLYCRRYISPTGRQFVSCKDVSSYLLSISEPQDTYQPNCAQANESIQVACSMASGNDIQQAADLVVLEGHKKENLVYPSLSPSTSGNCSNDHIGGQVKNDVNNIETSLLVNEGQSVDPVLSGIVPQDEPLKQAPIEKQSNVADICDASFNHEPSSDLSNIKSKVGSGLETDTGKFDHDLNSLPCDKHDLQANRNAKGLAEESSNKDKDSTMDNGEVGRIDESLDIVAVKSNVFLGSKAAFPSNENKGDSESRIYGCSDGPQRSENISPSPFPNEQTSIIENIKTGMSANDKERNQEAVSDSVLLSSEDRSVVPAGNEQISANDHMNGVTTPLMESEHNGGSESSNLTPSADKETCGLEDNLNRVSTGSASPKVDEIYNFGSNVCGSYGGSDDIDAMTSLEEEKPFENGSMVSPWNEQVHVIENFGNEVSTCSAEEPAQEKESESSLISEKHFQSGPMVSSWSEQVHAIENYGNEVSTCTVEEPTQQKKPETSLISLFDYEQSYGVEDYVDEVSTEKMEEPKFDDVQTSRNNGLNAGVGHFACSTKEKNLEFCSIVPSEIEQPFGVAENANGVYSNSGSQELSLAFGNTNAGIYADATGVEQGFGVETNLSSVNNNLVENAKQERGSTGGLFSLSFNGETCGFENNLDSVYGGRVWEGTKVDEVENSGSNKFMMGFGSGYGQPDGVASGVWRTGEGNMLQTGLADTSNALLQPSSSFCTFDLMSDKGQDGLFRLNEKYESQSAFQALRPGRSEPVEFSFLSAQNSNPLQGDTTKSFSYDTRMERQYDSSFWLGRDALMPNIGSSSSRDQITTICVWCRNQFHQEPVHFGTQAAIGPVCPTCRARISGHVNVL